MSVRIKVNNAEFFGNISFYLIYKWNNKVKHNDYEEEQEHIYAD